MNRNNLSIVIVFILALFLRLYHPGSYPLGFDQVQILENAAQIKSGDFTLIGPRTGPADMFTGPLVYYLCAFLMFFIPTPWTIVATSVSISIVTGLTLLFLLFKYFKPKTSLIYFSLWAFSPFLVSLDRIPWNPNISFLSSILVFIPLFNVIKKQKIKTVDTVLISLGLFLAYQAHFSELLLFPIIVLSALFFLKKTWKSLFLIISSVFSILFSLIPTIIFDIKNNFSNFNGLLKFSSEKIDPDKNVLLRRLVHNSLITIENFGKTIFIYNSYQLILFTGLTIVIFYFILQKRKVKQNYNLFIIFYLLFIVLVYIFYRESLPEYYFIIQLPVIFYLFSNLVCKIKNSKYIVLTFIVYSIFINLNNYSQDYPDSINTLLKLKKQIKHINQTQKISKLIYDVEYVNSLGIKYLLNDQLFNSPDGIKLHLHQPTNQIKNYNYQNNSWGLWTDPRQENYNYIEKDFYFIQTPNNIKLLQNYYLNTAHNTTEVYDVQLYDQKIATLSIYSKINNPNGYEQNFNFLEESLNKLKLSNPKSNQLLVKKFGQNYYCTYPLNNNLIFVFSFEPQTLDLQSNIVNQTQFLLISNEI